MIQLNEAFHKGETGFQIDVGEESLLSVGLVLNDCGDVCVCV